MSVRELDSKIITDAVRELCIKANICLPDDIKHAVRDAEKKEKNGLAKFILKSIENNCELAEKKNIPLCQDTGIACFHIEIGQDVHVNGSISDAVNEGVHQGYTQGFLRKSVTEPLRRINTGDNTPAIIEYDVVRGDKIKIVFAPKGFGSENMNKIKMLKPADGTEGVLNFVTEAVREAGANPCPPFIIGVGIGGNFERVALLSKKALLRGIGTHNSDSLYADLETELLKRINSLGIGAQGVGGSTTALSVNIETAPTHIAGLPVAVSIGCHSTRHLSMTI